MTPAAKPSVIAACDSQILMWAFPWAMRPDKKKRKTGQDVPEMRLRARILLKKIASEDTELCIPSVVVSELLLGVEPQHHAKVITEFNDRFFCPPFDMKACVLAARLWQFKRGLPGHSPGLPEKERTERRILKSDILIVASAKVAGATIFYSHEERCRRPANEAGMEAKDLPTSSGNWVVDQEAKEDMEGEDNASAPTRGRRGSNPA